MIRNSDGHHYESVVRSLKRRTLEASNVLEAVFDGFIICPRFRSNGKAHIVWPEADKIAKNTIEFLQKSLPNIPSNLAPVNGWKNNTSYVVYHDRGTRNYKVVPVGDLVKGNTINGLYSMVDGKNTSKSSKNILTAIINSAEPLLNFTEVVSGIISSEKDYYSGNSTMLDNTFDGRNNGAFPINISVKGGILVANYARHASDGERRGFLENAVLESNPLPYLRTCDKPYIEATIKGLLTAFDDEIVDLSWEDQVEFSKKVRLANTAGRTDIGNVENNEDTHRIRVLLDGLIKKYPTYNFQNGNHLIETAGTCRVVDDFGITVNVINKDKDNLYELIDWCMSDNGRLQNSEVEEIVKNYCETLKKTATQDISPTQIRNEILYRVINDIRVSKDKTSGDSNILNHVFSQIRKSKVDGGFKALLFLFFDKSKNRKSTGGLNDDAWKNLYKDYQGTIDKFCNPAISLLGQFESTKNWVIGRQSKGKDVVEKTASEFVGAKRAPNKFEWYDTPRVDGVPVDFNTLNGAEAKLAFGAYMVALHSQNDAKNTKSDWYFSRFSGEGDNNPFILQLLNIANTNQQEDIESVLNISMPLGTDKTNGTELARQNSVGKTRNGKSGEYIEPKKVKAALGSKDFIDALSSYHFIINLIGTYITSFQMKSNKPLLTRESKRDRIQRALNRVNESIQDLKVLRKYVTKC